MKITSQRIELEDGEQVSLALPSGQEITVGFNGGGQVPIDRPYIFVGSSENKGANFKGARAFEVTPTGKMKEYGLD